MVTEKHKGSSAKGGKRREVEKEKCNRGRSPSSKTLGASRSKEYSSGNVTPGQGDRRKGDEKENSSRGDEDPKGGNKGRVKSK